METSEQLTSTVQMPTKNEMDFVTVVSVGTEEMLPEGNDQDLPDFKEQANSEIDQHSSGYVTVLKIGQSNHTPKEIIEEVLVYRLPGERLGFGLKFEGGTKAAEFVKRLFIQSCAPDSPASMVHCSWGKLTEGDEVLNIDSLPVTSMTRIDCVRCLKDSNVVIKLLVRHFNNKSSEDVNSNDSSVRVTEDLPHVISAEKKRTPPPPPPVPPRKIPRKMLKESINIAVNTNPVAETDSSPLHHSNETLLNGHRGSRFHSPRSSGKFAHSRQSPEVSRHVHRDRRLSDGSVGPPDAEVYLDLFSQESGCSLSESDDTGSSISTIIDRFSSYPTTTNSSLAGSLPSTPTSIQKQLDISNILNPFDKNDLDLISNDNYLFTKLVCSENGTDEMESSISLKSTHETSTEKLIKNGEVANEEGTPLQPPTSFQDAPLSYGNEDVGVVEASVKISVREDAAKYNQQIISEISDENGNCLKELNFTKSASTPEQAFAKVNNTEGRKRPPPPPPPCEKPKSVLTENKDPVNEVATEVDGVIAIDLPRLVHFVPKYNKTVSGSDNQAPLEESSETLESVKQFLENEIRFSEVSLSRESDKMEETSKCNPDSESEIYNSELYNLTWSLSPQLATIGEDDEEGCQETYFQKSLSTSTPIVIIENADTEKFETENSKLFERPDEPDGDGNTVIDDGENSFGDQSSLQIESLQALDPSSDICEVMEAPPSSSRQPPDGDEFPDYHETPIKSKPLNIEESSNKLPLPWISNTLWKTNSSSILFRDQQSSCSVRDKIAIFSNGSTKPNDLINVKKICKSTDDIFSSLEKERFNKDKTFSRDLIPLNKVKRSASALCKTVTDHAIQNKEKINSISNFNTTEESSKTRSSLDLPFETFRHNFLNEEKSRVEPEVNLPQVRLHTRSQSLMDISSMEQTPRKDRWNILAEQRQKSLSKLKGLIIPEKVVEVDVPHVVDLPEIKSNDAASSTITSSTNMFRASPEAPIVPCQRNFNIPSLTTPPWNCNNSNNIPKYSPAFKRKSLQLLNENSKTDVHVNENSSHKSKISVAASTITHDAEKVPSKSHQKEFPGKPIIQPNVYGNQDSKISGNLCLVDAPKSLESITSPTRSDCSFEYVSSFLDIRAGKQESTQKVCQLDTRMGLYTLHKGKEDMGRSEDESDNDSAVSSSQSSYVSRTSPPTSPSHLLNNFTSQACSINESDSLAQLKCHSTGSQPHSQSGDNQNHRLLKPQSVEAINRKNILASAKCRSGRDLKIGSPLIQRKFEETAAVNASEFECNGSKCFRRCSTIYEKVNDMSVNFDSDIIQSEISIKEDSLLASNKRDLVNDSGTERCIRKEDEHTVDQPKSDIPENGIDTFSAETVTVTNSTIVSSRIVSKGYEKGVAKDPLTSDATSHYDRKVPTPKPLAKDLRSTSVTDLRRSFEKLTPAQSPVPLLNANLNKTSPSSAIKNNHCQKNHNANIQPSVKPQDVNTIEEPKLELTESVYKDVEIIVLRPEIPGGSVGITLAGGADYENKEITVHKIRGESSAHRDGRLQKGDKIVSINGKSVEGLTHKQLVALLKEPLPEVTLAVCKQGKGTPESASVRKASLSTTLVSTTQKEKGPSFSKQSTFVVSLVKDAAGLGLSLEGGQDSPLGNVPLLIKKVFKGGAAEKYGNLQMGDELLMINETDVSFMSRFEAWSVLKKLPEGTTISLTLRR